jgi:hypothetical protein
MFIFVGKRKCTFYEERFPLWAVLYDFTSFAIALFNSLLIVLKGISIRNVYIFLFNPSSGYFPYHLTLLQ